MAKLKKINKKSIKTFLNQRVRVGFLTLPLWLVGAAFVGRKLMARRRHYA